MLILTKILSAFYRLMIFQCKDAKNFKEQCLFPPFSETGRAAWFIVHYSFSFFAHFASLRWKGIIRNELRHLHGPFSQRAFV